MQRTGHAMVFMLAIMTAILFIQYFYHNAHSLNLNLDLGLDSNSQKRFNGRNGLIFFLHVKQH